MSFLSENIVARARKRKRCVLCGEMINVGESKVVRNGADCGDFWTMHMHPECVAYEDQKPVDPDWYDDCYEPAFERSDAIQYANQKEAK